MLASVQRSSTPPHSLRLIPGGGNDQRQRDREAWAAVAIAVRKELRRPWLSEECRSDLQELESSARFLAREYALRPDLGTGA